MTATQRLLIVIVLGCSIASFAQTPGPPVLIPVVLDPSTSTTPLSGRLLLLMTQGPNPLDGATQRYARQWIAAQDVRHWHPGDVVHLNVDQTAHPEPLSMAPSGEYHVAAWLDVDRNAGYMLLSSGDVRSPTVRSRDLRSEGPPLELRLTERIPDRPIPSVDGQELIEFVSPALSAFWGRPITMRGIVVLPPGYGRTEETYPTVFWTHGFGGRLNVIVDTQPRRTGAAMISGQLPPMVWVFLEQVVPSGTHEFADSVNNGPWGRALTTELIPFLEQKYRMDGRPSGRFLQGHSSGGWAALWLQVAYPTVFGGTWPTSPDPVDFRDFSNIDLYADRNAYRQADGTATPMVREGGRVVQTTEYYARREAVLGEYGGQTSSFEWVFSPRADDGRAALLFDRYSGDIDPVVSDYWRRNFDISALLAADADTRAPRLRGKIHVIVGTADDYFLDESVRLLEARLRPLRYDAKFTYLDGWTHFGLFLDGKRIATFGDDVLAHIAEQMYRVARPGTRWEPKAPLNPVAAITQ